MSSRQLESVREQLLRAGVAPRHVRRFLQELREHQEDALRAELAQGTPLAVAQEAAWSRLGTEQSLVQGMLERPELRSRAARFPALAFGLAPVLSWLGLPLALALVLSLLPSGSRPRHVDDAVIVGYHALCFLYTRAIPVLLGALALHMAAGRRLRPLWPLLGAGALDVLAGTLTVVSFPGQLGISSSLLPWLLPFTDLLGPREGVALAEGLLRAACLLALSLLAQRALRRLGLCDRRELRGLRPE